VYRRTKNTMERKLPHGWICKPYDGLTNFKVKSCDDSYINEMYNVTIIETQSNHRNNNGSVIRRRIRFTIVGVEKTESFEFEIPKNLPLEVLLKNYNNLFRNVYYKGFQDRLLQKN
jgi:hypothetical protein